MTFSSQRMMILFVTFLGLLDTGDHVVSKNVVGEMHVIIRKWVIRSKI
jgi:hypothetical protein